jgi:hypothetical protein
MGASAVLGLAVLASYGTLAAVALSAVGGGSVLSFPGWAVDAIIQVNAAPPPPTPQYGSVTATPTASPTGGQAIVVKPPAPQAGTTVAVSTSKHGGSGASQGGSGSAGGSGSGTGNGGGSNGVPPVQRPQPAHHRICERHALRFHNRCITPDQPARRDRDHDGPDSDHHHAWHHPPRHGQRSHHQHHAWHHPPRHEHSPPSHRHHHAWHHPPRHGHSPPSHHQHHAWHHPPRHGHHRHDGSSHDSGSHHHRGHHHDGGEDDDGSS